MIPLSLASQDGIFLNCTVITRPNPTRGFKDNLKVTGTLALTFRVQVVWIWVQRPAETGRQTLIDTPRAPPEGAACGCPTCRCKQGLVITWNGWKTPEGNLGGSSFRFALEIELLAPLPGNVQRQVQFWNVGSLPLVLLYFSRILLC